MTTPLDDANAKLRYSVEVVNLQINLEAQQAQVCVAFGEGRWLAYCAC